jgi:hypothetical protein
MADFALWAAACETALWPAGTVARAYRTNRRVMLESVIEADPVAACVRDLMAGRNQWAGTASEFLQAADKLQRQETLIRRPDWPRTPRALAGRLRWAQTSLRAVGIDLAFHREGRAGSNDPNARACVGGASFSRCAWPVSVPAVPATMEAAPLVRTYARGQGQRLHAEALRPCQVFPAQSPAA